jgi:hypothetical protein
MLRGTPQLEGFPLARDAFLAAAARWESYIEDTITIVIDVDFGPTRFGVPYPPGVLGSAGSQTIGNTTGIYGDIRAALVSGANSANETTIYGALPATNIPTDLGTTTGMAYPSAAFRAQGEIDPVADPDGELATLGPPPSIGFNSAFAFDFDPTNGIGSGQIDFDAVAVHEIGHVLGFVSGVGVTELGGPLIPSVWDLFRFSPGVTLGTFPTANRIQSSGGTQIFYGGDGLVAPTSPQGVELGLSTGRPNGTGGDGRQASHWKDDVLSGNFVGIMDPTLAAGVRQEINGNDLFTLDRFGYELVACPNTLTTFKRSFPASAGSGSIEVVAPTGCNWTAVSNDSWITIDSGAAGNGDGMIGYSVEANLGLVRSGTITAAGQTFTVFQGRDFTDVPPGHPFYTEIGKLAARGVTLGCGGSSYCPDSNVTREQMAAFIIRALGQFSPPPPAMQRFADVPPSNPFYAFIEEMALRQITLGCGGGNYCPSNPVLREQMAAFLMRALGEFDPPTPGMQRFGDVPPTNPFYDFIERLAQLQITLGCGGGNYCPGDSVNRGQMAAFLVRAFNL